MNFLERKYAEMEAANRFVIAGQYKMVVRGEDGKIRRETDWFDNLILNAGLNRMGTAAAINGCAVGTGTTPPTVSETNLQIPGAWTATTVGSSVHTANTVTPYHHTTDRTYRFALGALNGNYSEVGVGWSSTTMFSRALIVDGVGDPTSIPVSSTEQLDVVYRLRTYVSEVDSVQSITISGVTYSVTKRPAIISSNNSASYGPVGDGLAAPLYSGNNFSSTYYSGPIGAITSQPSGTSSGGGPGSIAAYSNNSYTNTVTATAGLTNANLAGGISSLICGVGNLGGFYFQYGFSTPILKDSTKTLALVFSASWGRRP